MSGLAIIRADARHLPLADRSVQCVVTSPPYWGLRKYAGEQESVWAPATDDPAKMHWQHCDHEWAEFSRRITNNNGDAESKSTLGSAGTMEVIGGASIICGICGAWRGAFGLEPTVQMYVEHSVEILREIRRVLRDDGVLFWNLGDSYSGNRGNTAEKPGLDSMNSRVPVVVGHSKVADGLKPKDLVLMPARVALAAQADGWWIRSDIIWAKPNPMPESVRDRPTDAYEHILMLTKSARYFWDADAVREPHKPDSHNPEAHGGVRQLHNGEKGAQLNEEFRAGNNYNFRAWAEGGRNIRNVWTFPTQPYKGSHFATFPEEIPRRCILAASRPGDLILDPFAGSGTTGRVAIELNRRAVLVDLAYHDLSEKRTKNVQRNLVEARPCRA